MDDQVKTVNANSGNDTKYLNGIEKEKEKPMVESGNGSSGGLEYFTE